MTLSVAGSSVSFFADDSYVVTGVEGSCVVALLFDAEGSPAPAPIEVSTGAPSCAALNPPIVRAAAGTFVVTWLRAGVDDEIYARRFDASGTALGPEIVVAALTSPIEGLDLAIGEDGAFAVAWSTDLELNVRSYDSSGAAVAPAFVAAQYSSCCIGTDFDVEIPTAGELVALWANAPTQELLVRRFDSAGVALGPEIVANQQPSDLVSDASLVVLGGGAYRAFWFFASGRYLTRAFDAADVAQGAEVNTTVLESTSGGLLTASVSDGFLALRSNSFPTLRRLDATGLAAGDPYPVRTSRALDPSSGGTVLVTDMAAGGGDRLVVATTAGDLHRFCDSADPTCDRCTGFDDSVDADADGIPDGCDACINPGGAQDLDTKTKLFLSQGGDAKSSKLRIRGEAELPVAFSSLAPQVDGIRVVIRGRINGEIVNARLPGGAGWRSSASGRKWRFKGTSEPPSGEFGGDWKVTLADRSSKDPGHVRLKARHDRGVYRLFPANEHLDVPPLISVVLGPDSAGQVGACTESRFVDEDCDLRNVSITSIKCR